MLAGDGYAQQTPATSTPAATTPAAPAATTPKAASSQRDAQLRVVPKGYRELNPAKDGLDSIIYGLNFKAQGLPDGGNKIEGEIGSITFTNPSGQKLPIKLASRSIDGGRIRTVDFGIMFMVITDFTEPSHATSLFLTNGQIRQIKEKMELAASGKEEEAAPAATTPKAPAKKTGLAAKSTEPAPLKTKTEKFSYALGMDIGAQVGSSLKKQSVEVDWNLTSQGLKDVMSGGKTRLTQEEAKAVLDEVQAEVRKEQQEKMQQAAATNKAEGEKFLAANKTKEGVVTLPSGLQYKILKKGDGPKPTASDTVSCNYRGTLIDGKEFDSSYKRGQAASFPVSGVIKGWTEALQLMPVGSKWELYIPSDLAYGDRGNGPIGPGEALIFEIELLGIQNQGAQSK